MRRPGFTVSLAVVFCLIVVFCLLCSGAKKVTGVYDGFAARGVMGRMISGEQGVFFELTEPVTDGRGTLEAGHRCELLPSSTLERLVADANERGQGEYRLWGRFIRWEERNLIFPAYFLPVESEGGAVAAEDANTVDRSQDERADTRPADASDANDAIVLPEEVLAKIRRPTVLKTERLIEPTKLKQDHVLIDAAGYIDGEEDGYSFVLDGLGWNVPRVSLELLRCGSLAAALHRLGEGSGVRFRVSGIVTEYEGRRYLLLQRATRAYGHGNFRP